MSASLVFALAFLCMTLRELYWRDRVRKISDCRVQELVRELRGEIGDLEHIADDAEHHEHHSTRKKKTL